MTTLPKNSSPSKNTSEQKTAPNLIVPNTVITFELEWSIVQKTYTQVLSKASKLVKLDGFRIGKVPPSLAEKSLDPEKLYNRVLDVLLPTVYAEELKKSGSLPLTQPEINPLKMKAGENWEFEASFAVRPVIELGKYQDVAKKALKEAAHEIADLEKKNTSSPKLDINPNEIKTRVVLQALIESIKPQIQELLIRQEVTHQLQKLSGQLEKLKLTAENYLKSRNMTAEELQREYTGLALTTLQLEFLMAQIALDQKITVTDDEVDKLLDQDFEQKLSPEQKQNQNIRSYVFSTQLKQKVLNYLLAI